MPAHNLQELLGPVVARIVFQQGGGTEIGSLGPVEQGNDVSRRPAPVSWECGGAQHGVQRHRPDTLPHRRLEVVEYTSGIASRSSKNAR